MPQRCHESDVRVLGMNNNAADGAGVAQANERPGLARVDGFIYAVSVNNVAADAGLACAGIDHIRIGRRNGNGADGRRHVFHFVGHGTPGQPSVRGLPDAATHAAEIISVRVADNATDSQHASATEGPNQSPGESMPWAFRFVLVVGS